MEIAPVVILAGGLGTRLKGVTNERIPKIMAPVLGKPFIHFKLKQLANAGVTEVFLLLGVGSDIVKEYVIREHQDLQVKCVDDGEFLRGTGGAILNALDVLPDEFWITYGDNLVETDFLEAQQFFKTQETEGIMCVFENKNLYDKSNLSIDSGKVVSYSKDLVNSSYSWIDYGLIYMKKRTFENCKLIGTFDLSEVISNLIESKMLSAWEVSNRFWEIGTPQSLQETETHLKSISDS